MAGSVSSSASLDASGFGTGIARVLDRHVRPCLAFRRPQDGGRGNQGTIPVSPRVKGHRMAPKGTPAWFLRFRSYAAADEKSPTSCKSSLPTVRQLSNPVAPTRQRLRCRSASDGGGERNHQGTKSEASSYAGGCSYTQRLRLLLRLQARSRIRGICIDPASGFTWG
jgi:hypothetical protein